MSEYFIGANCFRDQVSATSIERRGHLVQMRLRREDGGNGAMQRVKQCRFRALWLALAVAAALQFGPTPARAGFLVTDTTSAGTNTSATALFEITGLNPANPGSATLSI